MDFLERIVKMSFVMPESIYEAENTRKHAKNATTDYVIPVSVLGKKTFKNGAKAAEINPFYPVLNTVHNLFVADCAEKQRVLNVLDKYFPENTEKWVFPTPDKGVNAAILDALENIPSEEHYYDEFEDLEDTGHIVLKAGHLNEFKDYRPVYEEPLDRFYDDDPNIEIGLEENETHGAEDYWDCHVYDPNQGWYSDNISMKTVPVDVCFHEDYIESMTNDVDITLDVLKACVAYVKHYYPEQMQPKTLTASKADSLLHKAGYLNLDCFVSGNYMHYDQSGEYAFTQYIYDHLSDDDDIFNLKSFRMA